MKSEGLHAGLCAEITSPTTAEMGITHLGEGAPSFLSTPSMIGLMEKTAIKLLTPYLEPGEQSVGVNVNVNHLAATPIGKDVTTRATLKKINGRRCLFAVEAFNDKEKIGEGTHERAIINVQRFAAKAGG